MSQYKFPENTQETQKSTELWWLPIYLINQYPSSLLLLLIRSDRDQLFDACFLTYFGAPTR